MIAAGDGILSFIASVATSVATNGAGGAVAQALTDKPEELKSGALKQLAEKASGKVAEKPAEPTDVTPKAQPKPDGSATVRSAKRFAPTVRHLVAEAGEELQKKAEARGKVIDDFNNVCPFGRLTEISMSFQRIMQNPDTSKEVVAQKSKAKREFKNIVDKYDSAIQQLKRAKENYGDPEGQLGQLISQRMNHLNALRKLYMNSEVVDNDKPKTPGRPNGSSVQTGRTRQARKGHSKRVTVRYGSFNTKYL